MVTPSYYPITGGTETLVEQLTLKLNQRGIHTDVMTFNMATKWTPKKTDETVRKDDFNVIKVAGLNPLDSRFNLVRIFLNERLNVHVIPKSNFSREFGKYDVIHFHDDIDLSFPFFSYLLHFRKKPKLLHCHSLAYTYRSYRKYLLSGDLLRRVADLYVGLSEYSIKLLLNLGLPKSRLATLPNAVDTEIFRPDENTKTDNLILFVGRIIRSKGLDVLLRALFQLNIQAHLIIVGPVSDPLYFSEIQRLIHEINAGTVHTVRYLGKVNKDALIEWYQKASIFVCPSLYEPFGIVNIEALASGTPVIASRVGGIPDVVNDGVSGRLVPANDPLALASALEELLNNRKLRLLYARQGRKIVEQCFSWNIVLKQLMVIYEKLTTEEIGEKSRVRVMH